MTNTFLSFFAISISVSVIVIVVIMLTPFLSTRYASKWKYLIWIFLSLRLLVPFSGANGQFAMNMLSQTNTQPASEIEEKNTDIPTDTVIPSERIIVEIPVQMTTPIAVQSGINNAGLTLLDIVTFIWIIGSLIFVSVHFISYFQYKRQVMKKGRIIGDIHILRQISELKCELHIRRTIQAIEYHKAESPMIIGFLKPVLVLPKEQYISEELFFILKHELVHLKRGDVYFKLLFVTANAVHWFNPFIWIMQKEAAIDMELSCDERVIQGASYAVRKAYTETLLSLLHNRCTKKTGLSTQFYGGKKIMKKRFKNILLKSGKKNGISILICAVILTISFGALIGCSFAKEDTGNVPEQLEKEDIQENIQKNIQEDIQMEQMTVDNSFGNNNTLKNTTILTFLKEGEEEQKHATLVTGNGYSIYLPDDEWQLSDSGIWTAVVNTLVRLWIVHFKGESLDSIDQELADNGYVTVQNYNKQKQVGDMIYNVGLKEFENDVWGIFYCYPTDSEEGWGRELPVIADTFTLSIVVDDEQNNSSDNANEYLGDEDCQEIENIVVEFATAYFDGNIDVMRKFLASTYEGEIDIYESTGTISDLTVKGLSNVEQKKIYKGKCTVSLEFKDSNYENMFYLTFEFIRQEDRWKIQSYGVEG